MSWLTERYLTMCLLAQVMLSMMNSLFNLPDLNAMIALFGTDLNVISNSNFTWLGFYGLHQNAKNAFLLVLLVIFGD